MNIHFENYQKLVIKFIIVFQVFIKFSSSERITGSPMSHLYFNEESDYSGERHVKICLSLHHSPPQEGTKQIHASAASFNTILEQEISIGANARSSHWRCSIKKAALKNFAKFTEKHQCQSPFLIKLQVSGNFFTEQLRATASGMRTLQKRSKRNRLSLLQRGECNTSCFVTRVSLIYQEVEFFFRFLVQLKVTRRLGESKVLSFCFQC